MHVKGYMRKKSKYGKNKILVGGYNKRCKRKKKR